MLERIRISFVSLKFSLRFIMNIFKTAILSILLNLVRSLSLIEGKDIRALIEIGDTQEFELPLTSLEFSSQYEVRISYLGTVAGHFELSWACPTLGRKLLDTEKIVFSTDEKGQPMSLCSKIAVRARRNSRSVNQEASKNPIWFNIRLDKFNSFPPVPSSVTYLVYSFAIIIVLIPILYFYLKSQLGQISSDLKLQSSKSH